MNRPPLSAIIFGTGFGIGFWPWGSGTAGALLATVLWLSMAYLFSPVLLFGITLISIVVFTFIGTWAANRLEALWGADPKRVVIDEMVGVWIPLLAAPANDMYIIGGSFILFRFFDILKPWGIRALDRKQGGFWVMADDLLAGVYSLIVILVIRWIL